MTDPTASTPSSPPAGWYPDPAGTSSERYWNGSSWTEQLRSGASAQPQYQQPQQQAARQQQQYQQDTGVPRYQPYTGDRPPMVAPGTKTTTPWIWVIVGLPLILLIGLLTIDYERYLADTLASSYLNDPTLLLESPAYLGVILFNLFSFLVYAATVVLAFLDFRALKGRGVVKPFHWAWSFLGAPVYVIGRSVIVFRRSRGGLLPLWVFIGVYVITFISSLVKVFSALNAVFADLPTTGF